MTRVVENSADTLWNRLRADFWFWLGIGTLIASVVPYFVPILTADQLFEWGWVYADVPAAIVGWVAVAVGLKHLPVGPERTFWSLLAFAYGAVVGIELANAFIPDTPWEATIGLVLDSAYMVYYAALILAATASGSLQFGSGARVLHRLRVLGLSILGVAYLVYFQAVPSQPGFDGNSWYPGLMLYAALDFVVCLLLVRAARGTNQPRWRGILLGLAVLNGVYGLLDGWEAVLYLEPFADVGLQPQWDLLWYPPEFFFFVYVRGYLTRPEEAITELPPDGERKPDRGLMLAGLLALPVLHWFLYYVGLLDEQLRDTREGVIVVFAVALGLTLVAYFRALEHQQAKDNRELMLGEERYRTFLRRRVDGVYRAEATQWISTSMSEREQVRLVSAHLLIAEATDPGATLPDGTPAGLALGRPLLDVFADASPESQLREWIDQGYRADFGITRSLANGEAEHVGYTLTGIVEDGALVRAWLTRADTSAERNAKAETDRLSRELERARKLESIGTLAGGIAHDFNNLLLPIIGYTEIARSRIGTDDEDARESLGHVLGASERAAELVRQILSVSRVQPTREEPFSVRDVLDEALALVRSGLPKTIRIETSLQDCPPVLGDAGRIHQVIMNVCTNAAQAIEAGRGNLHVSLTHDSDGDAEAPLGWVEVVVEDDGSGIVPEAMDRIFEPFYTTKEPGEGTGLGLSVAHGIVLAHGGRIAVESRPGVGTKVVVQLPASAQSLPSSRAPMETSTHPLRVLVLDDRPDVAAITSRLLESRGHTVTSFTDPDDARAELRDGGNGDAQFDVLVTDYSMDGITGLELMDELREVAPQLGVVISTGYSLVADGSDERFIKLQKPFNAEELASSIRQAHQRVQR